ncbi:torsin-1A-interacting protein 1-like [Pelodytes ibericus]
METRSRRYARHQTSDTKTNESRSQNTGTVKGHKLQSAATTKRSEITKQFMEEEKKNVLLRPPIKSRFNELQDLKGQNYWDEQENESNEEDSDYEPTTPKISKPVQLPPNHSIDESAYSDDDNVNHSFKQSYRATATIPGTLSKSSGSSQTFCLKLLLIPVCLIIGTYIFLSVLNVRAVDNKIYILNAFQKQVGVLRSAYPSQSDALWKRSQRILEIHLNKSRTNKEPAIILLTAANDAAQTLLCVSKELAKAYAMSRNSSYTMMFGADQMYNTSEEAKKSIDRTLISGFDTTSKAAVLHQLEMLPPGALLILYKYCDHENAAFKDVALVLTVLLPDAKLDPEIPLKDLEEKVRDFLSDKFTGTGLNGTSSHSEMDMDKLGGVWSRISHVVLPVLPESNLGRCDETEMGD